MISVICVYNDRGILEDFLLKGLKDQTVDFELILVDNTKGMFSSAAEALNHGANNAKGKYLLFVHQDIDLSWNKWLEESEKILDSLADLGIAGVAGRSESELGTLSNIEHGIPPSGVRGINGRGVIRPEIVQTLDECLVIIPRTIFDMAKFDAKTCDGWHLYAVDYCLSLERLGIKAYVLPMYVYHASAANSMSESYFAALGRVLKKHKDHYGPIHTTVGNWNARHPLSINRLNYQIFIFKYYSKHLHSCIIFKRALKNKLRYVLKKRS